MSKGVDTGSHPKRKVHREAFQNSPDYLDEIPHPGGEPEHEPDYEEMHNRRLERRRPDGDTW